MPAEIPTYRLSLTTLQVLAQAYGSDTYNSNSYNGSSVTVPIVPAPAPSPTTGSSPLVPHTGFFAEPPIVTIPVLLVVAIVAGSISFAVTRAVRRHRDKRS